MADGGAPAPVRRFKLRPWLRALHRDLGYLAVGLTLVYAISGLAVNHVADWNPSFAAIEREYDVPAPLPDDDQAAAAVLARAAGITDAPIDVYRVSDDELEVAFEQRTLHANPRTGHVFEEGESPRPFLRVANWLHLNRGKKAWIWFADGYALGLLVLATTGLFMIPGRKGLLGRGAVIAAIGVALPLGYLWLAGGP
ncbi:MAG: PepSY-associated TM helix domain-containing protein [Nannocystaceae bacterium]